MANDQREHGMALADVFRVLDALSAAGCRYWLEGGWGVDALVGRPTRSHRDVDIDIDSDSDSDIDSGGGGGGGEEIALTVLAGLGYEIETDWRPNRVELVAVNRGWVDVHPLLVEPDGSARQAALSGGYHHFPSSYFGMGSLNGRPVPCFSVAAQRLFHSGYEPRAIDVHDLALLDALETGTQQ